MTQIGVILGTAAYMSPEQAKGRPADKRSDIWAFGCVLYEMLAGRRAFEGEDVSDTLAAVLRGEPDWSALPGEVPPLIRRLLRRCLAKDRSKRLSDAAAARLDIDEAVANPEAPVRNGVPPQQRRRERIMWIGMASLAVVTAAAIAVAARASRIALPAPEMRVDIVTPPSTAPGWVALSPDGKKIAFVVRMDGEDTLWLRSLEDGSTRALAGTEGATAPFWSPDSRSIAFGGRPGLRRLDLADGSIRTLAYGYGADGGTWNRQGVIVFAPTSVSPLVRLSADTGGTPVPVTHVKAGEVGHVRPQFLADGEHLVYDVRSAAPNVGGIYVTSLDGAEPKRLVSADSALVVSDHLVFARQGELFAQPFDGSRLELVGEPFRVASLQPVRAPSRDVPTPLSASSVGSIAFRVATGVDEPQLRWFDRQGKEIGRIDVPGGDFGNPDLSPDERRLAVRRLVNGNADIWTFDLVRGVWARTTSDAEAEGQPVWSPDGSRIAYFSARQGSANFYVRQASGAGAEELLLATTRIKKIEGWSPDGRYIVYSSPSETNTSGQDLWLLPLVGDRKPSAIVQNGFSVRNGQFSPDGRWIAYESNESGRYEIYAQPFPGPGERVQISTTGGAQARWRRDGRELFYIAIDDGLMAVPLRYSAGGRAIDVGAAVHLFATRIRGGAIQGGGNKQQYVVSGDGQRFLINTAVVDVVSPITLILNWKRSR
jgi:Tol biopolymer transport system component